MFGEGISKEGELIDYGVKLDLVDKSGTWFSYKDIRLGQGREKAKAFLKENTDVARQIEEAVRTSAGFDLPELGDEVTVSDDD